MKVAATCMKRFENTLKAVRTVCIYNVANELNESYYYVTCYLNGTLPTTSQLAQKVGFPHLPTVTQIHVRSGDIPTQVFTHY